MFKNYFPWIVILNQEAEEFMFPTGVSYPEFLDILEEGSWYYRTEVKIPSMKRENWEEVESDFLSSELAN